MYEDAPDELVHDVFAGTIWQSHPLGRPIIGDEKTVQGLSREQIISFYQKYYSPGNLVISVAGNLEHQQVINALNDTFGKLSGAKKERLYTIPEPARQVVCRVKDTEQVHICLGTPGLALDHENIYVFQIISTILGGRSIDYCR